jgi:hypothetical protein
LVMQLSSMTNRQKRGIIFVTKEKSTVLLMLGAMVSTADEVVKNGDVLKKRKDFCTHKHNNLPAESVLDATFSSESPDQPVFNRLFLIKPILQCKILCLN